MDNLLIEQKRERQKIQKKRKKEREKEKDIEQVCVLLIRNIFISLPMFVYLTNGPITFNINIHMQIEKQRERDRLIDTKKERRERQKASLCFTYRGA